MAQGGARLLSHSEIESALTCFARHAFAYTGHLSGGDTLKRKELAPILSAGRAWGAAVAAWHQNAHLLTGPWEAHVALITSLDADELEMIERGYQPDPLARVETQDRLAACLDHYIAITDPLPSLSRLEDSIIAGVPSRTGRRASTRYKFLALIDGFTYIDGNPWIVEFKFRTSLTPGKHIAMSRQIRRYAWAFRQVKGVDPVGVIVDETLNRPPGQPKVLKNGKTSHDKAQFITPEAYIESCQETGVEPVDTTVEALRQREWHKRFPVMFRDGELDEAGLELVSAAKLIRDLDSGELYPIRNTVKMHCQGCRFLDICEEPDDDILVDSHYERTVPKRLREPIEEGSTNG